MVVAEALPIHPNHLPTHRLFPSLLYRLRQPTAAVLLFHRRTQLLPSSA